MRKIIISLLTVVFLILIFPLSLVKANHAACPDLVCGDPYSCTGGQCSDCTCQSDPCVDNEDTPGDECVGGSGGGSCNGQYTCGPGFYCSNSGCTEVGGGGSSYRPAACTNRTVNCPAGQIKALNHPLNVFPQIDNGNQMCAPGLGSAQQVSGCWRNISIDTDNCWLTPSGVRRCEQEIICVNNEITTYGCCPTGQTSTVTYTTGANYTRPNSCVSPTTCNDSDDVYLSHVDNPASVCYTDCARYNLRGNCAEPITVYNVTTTCQTKTPVYTCVGGINGVCGTSAITPNTCNPGTVTNPLSGATAWTWTCVGSGAGATNASCSLNKPITALSAWWQVKDGDVTTNGNISSTVPVASLFDTNGSGGFPGVPVYSGGLSVGFGGVKYPIYIPKINRQDQAF